MNSETIFAKTLRVIESCETVEQLRAAKQYLRNLFYTFEGKLDYRTEVNLRKDFNEKIDEKFTQLNR